MENNSAQEILKRIKESKYVLINMDTRTDFDALCSATVFSHFLDSLNIKHKVIHTEKIPDSYSGHFDYSVIEQETDIKDINLNKFDLVILTDCSSANKISKDQGFKLPENILTINIDHHSTNDYYADLNYVFPYGSACTVLYQFFKENNIELPKKDLEIIYIGIYTDTGLYKYKGICAEDFIYTAEIIQREVNIHSILDKFKEKETLDEIKYKQIIYKNLKINKEKKFAYSTITLKEIADENIDMDKVTIKHSEIIRYLENIDFCFGLEEKEPGKFKVSFRTDTPDFDISMFAKKLGGGGHKQGAGANVLGVNSIQEALDKVLNIL